LSGHNGQVTLVHEGTIGTQVLQVNAAIHERSADKQPPVALERVLLAAHQGHPLPSGAREHAVESDDEAGLPGHQVVAGVTVGIVMLWQARPPTQAIAEEHVADLGLSQCGLQRAGREVLAVDPIRIGPDVSDRLHASAVQQCEEVRQLDVGVPDGEDSRTRIRHGSRAIFRVVDLIWRLP
jgi:hypothetical protein